MMVFYTVVDVPTVAPNPCLEFSRHFDSTTLHVVVAVAFSSISKKETIHHVEANHDHREYVEAENGLEATACFFRHQKCHGLFSLVWETKHWPRARLFSRSLLPKAFLARLVISCLITCSAFRLTPRVKPAFNPLKVLLGSFKGFRVLLSLWRPPRNMSANIPFPS